MPASTEMLKAALLATGKFDVISEICEGANATAFKGYHNHLQRDVFLKLYDYVEDARSEVLKEPRLLVQATQSFPKCSNIVEVYDAEVIVVGGEQYLCLQMEFVQGQSLLALLNSGPGGQQDGVRIVTDVLNGVTRLHSQRMLHRDLKPANILVSNQTAKLTDFGSVAILPDSQQSVTASKHSALYVPPEGWEVPSRYGFSSDVYQVGLVLYELVNGPFNYNDSHYVTKNVLRQLSRSGQTFQTLDDCDKCLAVNAGIRDLASRKKLLEHGRACQPYYSRRIRRIVAKATDPVDSRRYETATGFLQALSQINVPNWRKMGDNSYEAPGWNKWDWRVSVSQTASGAVIVERSRPGKNQFRKLPGRTFTNLEEAFATIEAP